MKLLMNAGKRRNPFPHPHLSPPRPGGGGTRKPERERERERGGVDGAMPRAARHSEMRNGRDFIPPRTSSWHSNLFAA